MKKYLLLIILSVSSLFLVSCFNQKPQTDIVTTMYPHYDIARTIAGDKLSVSLLTPPGTEIHDFEPTAKDIINIKNSKLFLYTSNEFEPWVTSVVTNKDSLNINISKEVFDESDSYDIHYWTDPTIFIEMIEVITSNIIKVDPSNKEFYLENKVSYQQAINNSINQLKAVLSYIDNSKLYFYGHNALVDFADYFKLDIITINENNSPNGEFTPKQIEELKNEIIKNNINYVFVEELTDDKVIKNFIKLFKNEKNNLEVLELHSYHNVTVKQFKEGVTYNDLFQQNIKNIEKSFNIKY